ncbi:MAG TPA: hypothetical protein VG051_07180 [Candidatus Acidoferrum sp.]|nr:hypothetical protein [Candidatus Acidoferrum sp.]
MALWTTLAAAQAVTITRAYADGSGGLHVVTANGKDITVPKEKGQTGAEEIKITNDHQTLGWLVVYPNPDPNRSWEKLYGKLVLWRDGKVLRRFSTEQVFWSWGFWQDGKQVAFHTGPLHGFGRSELHDLTTGFLVAAFNDDDTGTEPDWAQSLDP